MSCNFFNLYFNAVSSDVAVSNKMKASGLGVAVNSAT